MAAFIKKAGREGKYDIELDLGEQLILKSKFLIVPACPIRDSVLIEKEKGFEDADEIREDEVSTA